MAAVSSHAAFTVSPRRRAIQAKLPAPAMAMSAKTIGCKVRRIQCLTSVGGEIVVRLCFPQSAMMSARRLHLYGVISANAVAALAFGCATASSGGSATAATDAPQSAQPPLASMAGRVVVVLPIQYWWFNRTLPSGNPDPSRVLRAIDAEIDSALRARGVTQWTFAPQLAATARRNLGMVADPYQLSAQNLRSITRASEDPLPEPLSSQIRSLTALRDTRYALLPLGVNQDPSTPAVKGVLRLYLIDSRTARVVWTGEVAGFGSDAVVPGEDSSILFAKDLAAHLADLVIRRQ